MSSFPDRPDHPDLWLISEALLDQDALSDSGQNTEDILGRVIDPGSATYAGMERAKRAIGSHPELHSAMGALAAMWIDGFMAGMQVQHKKTGGKLPQ